MSEGRSRLHVDEPAYDRRDLVVGIVHIGVGNFHRAHQAAAIDVLLRQGLGLDFAICGVGLLPGDVRMRDVLTRQGGRYVLELRHPDGTREPRLIGSIIEMLHVSDDESAVLERLSAPSTRIVSLTITEGGYNVDPSSGVFDLAAAGVQHDLANPDTPRTAFGLIVAALSERRQRGLAPFTVMSCDNIPGNGDVAREAVTAFARARDPELAAWIASSVAFPHSMVDRITPVTTEEDRRHAREGLGVDDEWPVAAEPFFQWVVQDDFPAGRPPLELAGVELVDDVAPYEQVKLRLLNGSHQAMAYLGMLAGIELVEDAIADREIRAVVEGYMGEAAATLTAPPGLDLAGYRGTLLERFSNSAIRDTLARLGTDASSRIPQFVVPTIRANRDAGRPAPLGALVLASWARFCLGVGEGGWTLPDVDRRGGERAIAAAREVDVAGAFLADSSMFGDLGADPGFVDDFHSAFLELGTAGVRATCRRVLDPRD